ncbi:MAG: UDP-3-O-(3-hydroxymyristoyl)glucosamine N-acyltransferase [Phycisphaerales bacterium]
MSKKADGSPVSLRVGELAELVNAEVAGSRDIEITHMDVLDRAGPGALSFIRSKRFARQWPTSKASAALVTRGIEIERPGEQSGRAILIVADADLALVQVLERFAPAPAARAPGAHPGAFIDPTATVGAGASVGPGCLVEAGASIGDGTVLVHNVHVGRNAKIGRACTLHSNVCVLDGCVVGDGCILHSCVVIGTDGFGYRPDPQGRGVVKIPHIGNVEIGAGVEIGANTCIDRAKFGSTIIGAGSKIDNLVQIGHGVRVGRGCLFAAQVGIAGSATFGDGVQMGGQVGVAEGLTVGRMARVGGQSGVMRDIPDGETWMGYPAVPMWEFLRQSPALKRLIERRDASER